MYTAIKRPGRNGNAMWTTTTGFNRADVCVYAQLSEHVDVGLHAYRLAVTVLVALPGKIRRGLVIVPGPNQQMIIRAALLSFSLVILYLPNSSTHI